jgi:MoaA/NifB/PqqE/SkfB family radical SAM enzyme
MCDVGMFNEEGTFFKTLRIDRKLHEIDINVFKRVVDETARNKPLMSINSTEPMMYKPLGEAINYCTYYDVKTAITTGAYNLRDRAEELADAKLGRLNVSIDGPAEVHNEIRGRKDTYERATEGIKKYYEAAKKKGYDPEIYINCTVTNLNYTKIEELYESLSEVPYTKLNVTLMWFLSPSIVKKHNAEYGNKYPISVSCFDDHINPEAVEIDVLHRQLNFLSKKDNVEILTPHGRDWLDFYFKKSDQVFADSPGCMASWYFTQILADGKVVVYTRCHTEGLGNINDTPLLDIWNGSKMKEWRDFIKRKKTMPMCARCDLAY